MPATTPVSCPPDLVASLLTSLTGGLSSNTGTLLPVSGLLQILTGGLGLGLPSLSLSALLSDVTHLLSAPVLPGLGSATGATSAAASPKHSGSSNAALAAACTTALSKLLPVIGGGG